MLKKEYKGSIIVLRYSQTPYINCTIDLNKANFEPLIISEEVDGYYLLMRSMIWLGQLQQHGGARLRAQNNAYIVKFRPKLAHSVIGGRMFTTEEG